MKELERIIYNSVIGKGKKLTKDDIYEFSQADSEAFVDVLFRVINTIVEDYPRTKKLYNVNTCFDYVIETIEISEDLDPSIVDKKIKKLEKKIDLIISKKLNNRQELITELRGLKNGLRRTSEKASEESTHRYDFIDYLIREPRNINFIEFTFKKIPVIMQAKDRNGISLFRNISRSYMKSLELEDDRDSSYYKTLIWLMLSQEGFSLTDDDKKGVLVDIYRELEKISNNPIPKREKREKLKQLENIKELIAPSKEATHSLEEIADKYDVSISFPERIVSLTDDYIKPITLENYPDRKVFKDFVVSIDGVSTVEIDDALSCRRLRNGHYLLGVHIASILGYYDYDSEIVRNAFYRAKSIYLRKNVSQDQGLIPMFPEEFSTDIGSLVEGKNRLARSYMYEVDGAGRVVDQRFLRTIIRNNKRATYDEINSIISSSSSNGLLGRTVRDLREVSALLGKNYHIDRLYELVKERMPDPSGLKVKKVGSEEIVYQCMLLTGSKVAEFFSSNNYPCLYRVHNVGDTMNGTLARMVQEMIEKHGEEEFKKMYELLDGLYPKGYYSISGNHQGLSLSSYCHCTSGLRRAADIVVEHALEVCYDKTPSEEDIAELTADILEKQEIINLKSDSIDWFIEDFSRVGVKVKTKDFDGR